MDLQTFEGTWEEIQSHASELAGRHVRLTVLDDESEEFPPGRLSEAERQARIKAFDAFTAGPFPQAPLLSDDAISRETIYAERG